MIIIGFSQKILKTEVFLNSKSLVTFQMYTWINLEGNRIYAIKDLFFLKPYIKLFAKQNNIHVISMDKCYKFFIQYIVFVYYNLNPYHFSTVIETGYYENNGYVAMLKCIMPDHSFDDVNDLVWHSIQITEEEHLNKDLRRVIPEIYSFYKNIFLKLEKQSEIFIEHFPIKHKYYDDNIFSAETMRTKIFESKQDSCFGPLSGNNLIVDYKNFFIHKIFKYSVISYHRFRKIKNIIGMNESGELYVLILNKRSRLKKNQENSILRSRYIMRVKTLDSMKHHTMYLFFIENFDDIGDRLTVIYDVRERKSYILLPIFNNKKDNYNYYIYYQEQEFFVFIVKVNIFCMYCPNEIGFLEGTLYKYFFFLIRENTYEYKDNEIKFFEKHSLPMCVICEKIDIRSIDLDRIDKGLTHATKYLMLHKMNFTIKNKKTEYYAVNNDGTEIKDFDINRVFVLMKEKLLPSDEFKKIENFVIDLRNKKHFYTVFVEADANISYLAIFTFTEYENAINAFIIYNTFENIKMTLKKIQIEKMLIVKSGKMCTINEKYGDDIIDYYNFISLLDA